MLGHCQRLPIGICLWLACLVARLLLNEAEKLVGSRVHENGEKNWNDPSADGA